jgi:hypothetical protein
MTETKQYGSLREKIAAEKAERLARYARFAAVYQLADAAGAEAAEKASPTPMVVVQHANPLDDSSPVVRQYAPVEGGVCGFAWVTVRPGNCSFALWAAKNKGWSKAYHGGMQLWVSAYGQSMERKDAYAQAFAAVLRDELGIRAYSGSRMD